jgi:hypothetical protein
LHTDLSDAAAHHLTYLARVDAGAFEESLLHGAQNVD